MLEIVAETAVYTALLLTALGVGVLIRRFRSWRDVRALPGHPERMELMRRLRELRASGADHRECVADLRRQGLRPGVARGLLIDLEREQVADVEHPQRYTWNGCRFEYPGNWKVTPLVDATVGVSVEGLGSSLVMLVRLVDDGSFDELAGEQRRQVREPREERIERWGALRGDGYVFAGPHAKLRLQVEIVVFRPAGAPTPCALVQLHALEEAELVLPGFRLMQRSFRIPAYSES